MSLLRQAPRFHPADASRLARRHYSLEATARPLPSERDQNFLLESPSGRFVLKIANAAETRPMLEAQNAALDHVARQTSLCPRVVRAPAGSTIVDGPGGHLLRLLTWVPGVPLGRIRRHSLDLLEDLGRRLGELDAALQTFDHPAIHRRFHWDLAAAIDTTRAGLPAVHDADWRRLVEREIDRIERRGASLGALRRSAIHNDANDYNVLVGGGSDVFTRHQRVTGVIDFGDLVHSYTVADLAIAIAYAVLDKADPLSCAACVVSGYHVTMPLLENEIAVLFDLVRLRLCLSVSLAAHHREQRPDDEYLIISQAPIGRTLPKLVELPAGLAEATFRGACGMPPVPRSDRVIQWLRRAEPHHDCQDLLDRPAHSGVRVAVVDLSVGSPLVAGDPAANAEPALTFRIESALASAAADIGVGRYLEPRCAYSLPLLGGSDDSEPRTVHLGIDLFAPAGTSVRAPLRGVVHAVVDKAVPLGSGPLIVLQHETDDGDVFYTLYGHLARESLTALTPGIPVDAGQVFAAIGGADVNGGWTPHLHFQLIVDLLDLGCDFPGVCRPGDVPIWRVFSPDPGLLTKIPDATYPLSCAGKEHATAARRTKVGRNLSLAYRAPLKIARGWMQYVFDDMGRRFLDAYNNVAHVGHCHPRVVRAAENQMRVLNTNTRYLHDSLTAFAERLTATLAASLQVCYFVNSGSEANELALRLAYAHTHQRDVIVLDCGYHGNTATLTALSPYKFDGPGGAGREPWVHVAPIPDVLRGPYKDEQEAARHYSERVGDLIEALRSRQIGLAAFLAETCPSVGGQIVLPRGYLQRVYAQVRAAGGVCIADEVQTAYGRMGSSFYAFEDHHIVPDILVLGKPIGNGYPLGAVITTADIASSFDNGMEFFSTFGGSTVSCAVGLAVLDVVEEEQLQAHARDAGTHLLNLLRRLAGRHEWVGDVRGAGLFVGVELVRERRTLEPAADEAEYVINRMRDRGVLIGRDGPFHNVLKIRPPMPFTREDGEVLVGTMDEVMGELS